MTLFQFKVLVDNVITFKQKCCNIHTEQLFLIFG